MIRILILLLIASPLISAEVRIGDIVDFQNIRENQVTGFGLVIGLSGTGDRRSPFTEEALSNYLSQLGVDTKLKPRDTRNVASVMIVAKIPGWVKPGDKIDVTVSSIGDARSLEGGVLLQSPLKAGNGQTIAVASGNLNFTTPGDEKGKRTYSKKQSASNTALIVNGAIIEKEINILPKPTMDEDENPRIRLSLKNPNYSLMNTIIEKLNQTYSEEGLNANVLNQRELEISIPEGKKYTSFLAEIEGLTVEPLSPARVVINEKTGTVIMGGNLAMDEVAISKTGLKVKLESKTQNRYFWTETEEKTDSVFFVKKIKDVKSLVDELNSMGATTNDIISILHGLKKSGLLHAEVVIQ
jgi:flagellar P-ring protein FlgI